MCHVGTNSESHFIAPPSEPRWVLTLIEPLRPYLPGSNKSRSDGRKLSILLTSRTPATRRGAPPTNSLAGLDAPLACAPSRQTSWFATREERGTEDRGLRVHKAHQGAVRYMEGHNT